MKYESGSWKPMVVGSAAMRAVAATWTSRGQSEKKGNHPMAANTMAVVSTPTVMPATSLWMIRRRGVRLAPRTGHLGLSGRNRLDGN